MREGEAETGAFEVPIEAAVRLTERFEDFFEILLGDAYTGVADLQIQITLAANKDPRRNGAAFGREFDGVA